ncbi:MAG: 2-C-methyl-D-erythritol 2,4-cyclodiphosphate synthase [Defluviitaleaceae bacterium]|nr:2-C-methyl-D-erythritol 2,4-cyclodiphosphate synthase [Defluviitaleaceae bacterium]
MRIGMGYDAHKLTPHRKLILGGVHIPFHLGLDGHSDADVLIHAIIDALLGAAKLGDIGRNFPDTNPQFKNIASTILLRQTAALMTNSGYSIVNIDSTIIAQNPRLAPFLPAMEANIASCLGINQNQINIKATTEENMGFTGTGEGISAHAVCLILSTGAASIFAHQ